MKLRIVRTLPLIALLHVLLAACGSAANSTTTESAATTTAPTTPLAAAIDPAAIATTPSDAVDPAASATTTSAEIDPAATATTSTAVNIAKLNLNEATEEELLSTIPGFGDRMVREFFEYRPYVSIQQFRREIGKYVDEAQVAKYEQYVYVPVDVDEADAATLQQLPGIDETIANELIAARPYGSKEAFQAKLSEYVSAEDQAQTAAYLAE